MLSRFSNIELTSARSSSSPESPTFSASLRWQSGALSSTLAKRKAISAQISYLIYKMSETVFRPKYSSKNINLWKQ